MHEKITDGIDWVRDHVGWLLLGAGIAGGVVSFASVQSEANHVSQENHYKNTAAQAVSSSKAYEANGDISNAHKQSKIASDNNSHATGEADARVADTTAAWISAEVGFVLFISGLVVIVHGHFNKS
jgi:hypothetical protein